MGILDNLQRGARGVNGLLFPGMAATGVDPRMAQAAQAQAMLQLGAGLLGGQNVGQAYGLGQAAGYEPIEQARRQTIMDAAAQDRASMAQERQRRMQQEEAAAAEEAAVRAEIKPFADAGDWESVTRILAGRGLLSQASSAKSLGKQPAVGSLYKVAGPGGAPQYAPAEQAVGMTPYQEPRAPVQGPTGSWSQPFAGTDPTTGQPGMFQSHSLTGEIRPVRGMGPAKNTGSNKPLPTGALRIVDEAKQAAAAATDSKVIVDKAIKTLESGGVNLGAVRNLESRTRNFMGASDDNSRAYADIRQTLEKLRNNYLLLAKGVQTEGDAQRAWNSEIGENVQNDNALALQQLTKAQTMIDRALEAQNSRVETVYSNYGAEPPEASQPRKAVLKSAPPAALEYLRAHPETAPAFKEKYGYLP